MDAKPNQPDMPAVANRFDNLKVGFAPYLQPPPDGVIRWTVGEPGFPTPEPVISTAVSRVDGREDEIYTGPRVAETMRSSC